jgi:hypothetical protein
VTEMNAFTAIALADTSQAASPDAQGLPTAYAELYVVREPVAVCLSSGVMILDVELGDVPASRRDRPGVRRAKA